MRKVAVASLIGAGVTLAMASGSASAAPTSGLEPLKPLAAAGTGGGVENVHWRYRHWHHRRWSYGPGIYFYGGGYRHCWWRHGYRHCRW